MNSLTAAIVTDSISKSYSVLSIAAGKVAVCDEDLNTLVTKAVIALILWDFWRFYRPNHPYHRDRQQQPRQQF